MTTTFTWEAAALDIVTAPIMLVVQAVAGVIWLLAQCLGFGVRATLENWRPLAKLALVILAAYILATNPVLVAGIALIYAYAKFGRKFYGV